ncbi:MULTISPECIES: PE-PPE domain-containing protein [unclassified Mycolicibacterium]|uniref:PE-PPE domain-containing protein n=1 Tax=unclassified Mycolicibacterium TaxID=2636767 RepID=UPI001391E36D|nr:MULTISPECIES: PE-PPE domain-containing protein [unclassified Mycolicibacterium]
MHTKRAGIGAGLLALTAMVNSALAYGAPLASPPTPPVAPVGIEPPAGNGAVGVAELMGTQGMPMPQEGLGGAYMGDVFTRYLQPNFPSLAFPSSPCTVTTCGDVTGLPLTQQAYPFTGVTSMKVGQSVAQDETTLTQMILSQLAANPNARVGVFGYYLSSDVASLAMTDLHNAGVPSSAVNFVLTGDAMNPNGGIDVRYGPSNVHGLMRPPLTEPPFGYDSAKYPATPDNLYPTAMYTLEYDGYADWPQYPVNFLADLNASLGIVYVQPTYPTLTAAQLNSAVHLTNTLGPTMTNYFMIPVTDLPLLDPVRQIPVIGNAIADLLQPDLTLLVNLGYDNANPLQGWSSGPPNVPTPFGLFPSLSQITNALRLLPSQTELGLTNLIKGLSPVFLPSISAPSKPVGSSGTTPAADPGSLIAGITNAVSSIASSAYGLLLPIADAANAILIDLPAYDASLFLDNITNPINAIGLPIAADIGLLTQDLVLTPQILSPAVTSIVDALRGKLSPNSATASAADSQPFVLPPSASAVTVSKAAAPKTITSVSPSAASAYPTTALTNAKSPLLTKPVTATTAVSLGGAGPSGTATKPQTATQISHAAAATARLSKPSGHTTSEFMGHMAAKLG